MKLRENLNLSMQKQADENRRPLIKVVSGLKPKNEYVPEIIAFIFLIFILRFLVAPPCIFAKEDTNSFSQIVAWQEAFVKIAQEVEPAVVSISTTKIVTTRFSPFYDEFFKEFFGDFFDHFFEIPHKEYRQKQHGLGSGVIIDKEGHILTNQHVIASADEIKVTLPNGQEFDGKIIGQDVTTDIAVVKIEVKKGERLPVAKLGDSDKIRVGEWAIAIGNPFAWQLSSSPKKVTSQPTVTVGVISALRRSVEIKDRVYEDLIQTDAAINPGNSGGPLVNIKGEVIGINTAILTPVGGNIGIGFAIPVNKAKEILNDLITKGRVVRGWLGILIQEITPELAAYFGLSEPKGVLVSSVDEGTPAFRAGMKPGDIILKFGDYEVNSPSELKKAVEKTKPKTKVVVVVFRSRKKVPLEVVVGEKQEELELSVKYWRGIKVKEITEEIVRHFRLDVKEGVVIVDIKPDTPAEYAGVKVGDIILKIQDKEIKSLRDFNSAVVKIKESQDAVLLIKRGRYTLYLVISGEKNRK